MLYEVAGPHADILRHQLFHHCGRDGCPLAPMAMPLVTGVHVGVNI